MHHLLFVTTYKREITRVTGIETMKECDAVECVRGVKRTVNEVQLLVLLCNTRTCATSVS